MERITKAEIMQTFKSSVPSVISPQLPQSSETAIEMLRDLGAPKWSILVLEMAQDKRHDLAPHTLRFWKEKLKDVPDALVCEALITGRWKLFPSIDEVLIVVEEIRERLNQKVGEDSWEHYKREQKRAEREGLLATDCDYAELRKKLRELFGDPTVKIEKGDV